MAGRVFAMVSVAALLQRGLAKDCVGEACSAGDEVQMLQAHSAVNSNYSTGFKCGAAWCAPGSVCCNNGFYGMCGSPGTTCCFSPLKARTINLCAPGSICNADGHCMATRGKWCGSKSKVWCAWDAECCDNGQYALCGSPGSTCCQGAAPNKILNLCAPGDKCNSLGNCEAR